jgi:hypothetical protein
MMGAYMFQDLVQRLDHPRGLWAVATLDNGELVTGCHDGVIRLFTRDVNKVAPPEVGLLSDSSR